MKFLPPKFNLFAFKSHRKIGCSSLLEREGERLSMPCFKLLLASFSNWSPLAFGDFLKSAFLPSLFFST